MKNYFKKTYGWALKHKVVSVIAIVVVVGGGYFWYASVNKGTGKVSYITAPVVKGTIVTSISGSGQVSASNQIDLKSKVSENVVYVGVAGGQKVRAGTLLMEFNTVDAQKSVRDAQMSLESAQLNLQKLAGSDTLAVPLNKQQAQDNLAKDYSDGFNTIANVFLNLPATMVGLNDVLFGKEFSSNSPNMDYYSGVLARYGASNSAVYGTAANASYQTALTNYNETFDAYKSLSRSSDTASIDAMLAQTYQTAQDISDATKDANNLIQFYENTLATQGGTVNSIANTQLTALNSYTGTTDSDLTNILSIQSSIKSDQLALANSDLDVQSQDLSLQQAQNSLADAKSNLSNCFIYAPFDGVVAAVDFKKGDAASSGSTAVTFISNQSITEIPLNEVDITKIKDGQKATLTFDAIDGLTIAGQVAQIDTLGTVTQGVVNYNVQLAFDSSGTQVKPGMSVTANIITAVKQDVLTAPNSAVKTSGGTSYVQVLVNGAPVRKTVQIGLSNDTDTEITSGLSEGDNVITQTISSAVAKTTTSTTSSIRIPGITGGGGGGFRGAGN